MVALGELMQASASVQAKREGGWLPVLAVLVVIVAVTMGGYVTAGALSKPAGPPLVIANSVRISPLSGWQVGQEGRVGDFVGLRLTRGDASLDVLTAQVATSREMLLADYVRNSLEPQARSLSVSQSVKEMSVDSGLAGLRISYVGAFGDRSSQVEGEVTAVVSESGTGVIFDAWGPAGLFGYSVGDTRKMIQTSEIM